MGILVMSTPMSTGRVRAPETRGGLLGALVLVLCGMGLCVAGVAVLLGAGFALLTGGVCLVVFALLADLSRVIP